MSWDIVLINSKQKIDSIEALEECQLESINFSNIIEGAFKRVIKDENHREIIGEDFSINFFITDKPSSNFMLSLYGEYGLYELIELAKENNWQIYDTGLDEMIDLENPKKNGYENHQNYLKQIINNNR